MFKITDVDPNLLKKAVLLWTGYRSEPFPCRHQQALSLEFSPREIKQLMPILNLIENDFYKSKAHVAAPNLMVMGEMAIADFRSMYPNLPEEIAQAFAWCYTFDFK